MFPLYDGADFRQRCGAEIQRQPIDISKPSIGRHTGFQFHNWIVDVPVVSHEYTNHGDNRAVHKLLKGSSADTALANQCVLNDKGHKIRDRRPAAGFIPIYFRDKDYVEKRHQFLKYIVYHQETVGYSSSFMTEGERHFQHTKGGRQKQSTRLRGKRPQVRVGRKKEEDLTIRDE